MAGEWPGTAEDLARRVPADAAYGPETIGDIAACYIWWAGRFGLRADVLWAQALLETNGFRFGGQITFRQFNFCGLRKPDGGGFYSLDTPAGGVLAHVAHLAVHALPRCPNGYTAECMTDPKHPAGHWNDMVVVEDLETADLAWCPSPGYAADIVRVWNRGV